MCNDDGTYVRACVCVCVYVYVCREEVHHGGLKE